jgi:hypothetical protein
VPDLTNPWVLLPLILLAVLVAVIVATYDRKK